MKRYKSQIFIGSSYVSNTPPWIDLYIYQIKLFVKIIQNDLPTNINKNNANSDNGFYISNYIINNNLIIGSQVFPKECAVVCIDMNFST